MMFVGEIDVNRHRDVRGSRDKMTFSVESERQSQDANRATSLVWVTGLGVADVTPAV